jgi:hypothetical protein
VVLMAWPQPLAVSPELNMSGRYGNPLSWNDSKKQSAIG